MNKDKFSDALGQIDDKYINEAIEYNSEKASDNIVDIKSAKAKKRRIMQWGSIAACVVILAGVSFTMMKKNNFIFSKMKSAENTTEQTDDINGLSVEDPKINTQKPETTTYETKETTTKPNDHSTEPRAGGLPDKIDIECAYLTILEIYDKHAYAPIEGDIDSVDTDSVDTDIVDTDIVDIKYTNHYIVTDYTGNNFGEVKNIIKSVSGLNRYSEENKEKYGLNDEFFDKCKKYDENFFKNNNLAIINIGEVNEGTQYTVKNIYYQKSEKTLAISLNEEIGDLENDTGNKTSLCIIIEIPLTF